MKNCRLLLQDPLKGSTKLLNNREGVLNGLMGGINPLTVSRVHTFQGKIRPKFPKIYYEIELPTSTTD